MRRFPALLAAGLLLAVAAAAQVARAAGLAEYFENAAIVDGKRNLGTYRRTT